MIYDRLNIQEYRKELICFVGGGGKTTAMFKLARELRNLNRRVLVTTTTAIFYPDNEEYDRVVVTKDECSSTFDNMNHTGITVLGSEVSPENKLLGVDKNFIEKIYLSNIFDYILIEADGSKRKSIKAPAEHEPVIPEGSTKVVGVIGLDCISREIDEKYVHRPEIFAKITNSRKGDVIGYESILNLIENDKGLFKGVPSGCERFLILNKVEDKDREEAADKVLEGIVERNISMDGFIVGSLLEDKYMKLPNEGNITAIIMASGFSRRMNTNKLVLPVNGIPCIERVIKAVCESDVDEIVLIYQKDDVKYIAEKYGLKTIYNDKAHLGQSEAVKLGVLCSNTASKGYMFFTGDQPFINKRVINKVVDNFEAGSYRIVVPTFEGKRGNPVIFSSLLKDELLKLEGDVGGRAVMEKYSSCVKLLAIDDKRSGLDMDTKEDYLLIQDGDETS
jgi:probable selenium-dependent hydroxylase accessory protein YqeC